MKKKQGIILGTITILLIVMSVVLIVFLSNKEKDIQEVGSANKVEQVEVDMGIKLEDAVVKEEEESEEPIETEPEKPEKPVEEKPHEQKPSTPKIEAIPGQHRDPNSAVVVIDPGHQAKGDSKKEPNGPDSTKMKARVTGGTRGVSTGVTEYVLNLDIGLKLKEELENRGYTVYMTRTTHNVNISNMERAQYAASVGADIAVRIHANSVDKSSVRGAEVLAPSSKNTYVSHLAKASHSLSKKIIDAYCSATGFKNRGVHTNDTMTGINWSEVPVTIIELGFMSNPKEDEAMQNETMQNNMVQGIANGIDDYFNF